MNKRVLAGLSLIALTMALGCACWAHVLQQRHQPAWALVIVAFVLSVVGARCVPAYTAPIGGEGVPSLLPARPRWFVVGSLALASCLLLQFAAVAPIVQMGCLLLSLISWIAAYIPRSRVRCDESRLLDVIRAGLFLVALGSCAYGLGHIPGNLYGDEASLATEVVGLLDGTKPVPPFGVGWGRSPALFTWFEAAGVWFFGNDIAGLRVAAIIGGALAVLPWFGLLRRELGVVVAALSALFLCASPAHQHLSRMAMSESWIRLCSFGALASLYVGLRSGRSVAYVASGISLGCCFYMANKAVLLPPVMLGAGIFLAIALLPKSLAHWRGVVLMLAAALVAFVPQLLSYGVLNMWREAFISHPARWINTPFPGGQLAHAEELVRLLWDRAEASPFTPFLSGSRIVSQVEGAMMLVGLGISVAHPRRPIVAFLLGWLVAGIASLWLDARPNQVPHAILVSCLPAAFAALVFHAWQQAAQGLVRGKSAVTWITTCCAVPLIVWNASQYLGRGDATSRWFGGEFTALGKAMQQYRDTHHEVLVTPPMSWDMNSTLRYLAPGYRAPLKLTQLDPSKPWLESDVPRDVAFIVLEMKHNLVAIIQARYPQAEVIEIRSVEGVRLLTVLKVPASEVLRVEAPLRALRP